MTVAELRDRLGEYPPHYVVTVEDFGDDVVFEVPLSCVSVDHESSEVSLT